MKSKNYKILSHKKDLSISAIYRDSGNEMIFFIHGLGCTKESFSGVWDSDELKKYSIFTFDLPGFGDSSKPEGFPYTMESQADVCKKLISKFSGKKFHIAAHSMGGAIGLLLVDRIPGLISTFLNIEGNLFNTDCSVSRSAVSYHDFNKFKAVLLNKLDRFNIIKSDIGTRLWSEWIEKSDPAGFNRSAKSLVEWTDSGELLTKFLNLECRKAYIAGEMNSRRKVLTMLGDIDIISIPASGHFPMNDNPEEFYHTLAKLIG